MGTGTDIAMEAADVALVKGNLAQHCRSALAVADDHAGDPAEPVLGLCL